MIGADGRPIGNIRKLHEMAQQAGGLVTAAASGALAGATIDVSGNIIDLDGRVIGSLAIGAGEYALGCIDGR